MLLMDFVQEVGKGWGPSWRGYFFRHSYPELADVIRMSREWFPQIDPGAKYVQSPHHTWTFSTGEQLMFRHFARPEDYWNYHGSQVTWVGFDELTTWPTPECYTSIFSCLRSTRPGIPIRVRSATNPGWVGHNWVKNRFNLPTRSLSGIGNEILTPGEPNRVAIHGDFRQNLALMFAQPDYEQNIRAAAKAIGGDNYVRAWVYGDWDITAGGMFDDLWDSNTHSLPAVDPKLVPRQWRLDRAYDHGQTKPFSVGWYAESNGEPMIIETDDGLVTYGPVRGDIIRIDEDYGWTNKADTGVNMSARDIARRILDREKDKGIKGRVRTGPADSQIFVKDASQNDPSKSVAGEMLKVGVNWDKCPKGPGSRIQGWQTIRQYLQGSIPQADKTRDEPGLFVTDNCRQFMRVFPVAPRCKEKPDDVDGQYEDHILDELSYRLRHQRHELVVTRRQRDY